MDEPCWASFVAPTGIATVLVGGVCPPRLQWWGDLHYTKPPHSVSPAFRVSVLVISPFAGGRDVCCAQTADHLGEICRKWGAVSEVDYVLGTWALTWCIRARVLALTEVSGWTSDVQSVVSPPRYV